MKHLILTMMLLLISCGTIQEKADELLDVAMICNEHKIAEENCDREWAEWNEAEEDAAKAALRRAAKKQSKCPDRMVAYCDRFCMRDSPAKRVWMCVRRDSIHIY